MSTLPRGDLVDQLKALGINEKTAKFALSRRDNDLERAADYALVIVVRSLCPSTFVAKTSLTLSPLPPWQLDIILTFTRFPLYLDSIYTLDEQSGVTQHTSIARTFVVCDMAPLDRSFSLPVSLPERVSRLKVFSGNAGKDEVSDDSLRRVVSPKVFRGRLPSNTPAPDASPEKTTSSSFKRWGRKKLGMGSKPKEEDKRRITIDTAVSAPSQTSSAQRAPQRNASLTQLSTAADDGDSDSPLSPLEPSSPISPTESNDDQASNLILGAMSRGRKGRAGSDSTGGALAAIGLKSAGIASPISPEKPVVQKSKPVGGSSNKGRAPSPFFRARRNREKQRARDTSPEVGALEKDAASESDGESVATRSFRPQTSAWTDDDDETELEQDSDEFDELDDDELELIDDDGGVKFDDETTQNTEANSVFYQGDNVAHEPEDEGRLDRYGEDVEQDVLGEGPNVVVPPEPLFPSSYMAPVRKRRTLDSGLELQTSRPSYARDRCTINLTHGDPDASLEESNKRLNRYVVLSDLSEESKYAVEWAIGTVARDGDEIFLISVKEDESKVDPKNWSDGDKSQKVKIQRERQQMALLLTKQVTSLLQRTRLNITVTCQFLHAKNSRHMLLDLIDFLEPTMVIVGSRGLGKLKGILLGSTSHYLVQKSSVPVMVARRRLQRPLRKTNPSDLRHSPRVSLASASIEKAASSKQEDEIVDVANEEETTEGPAKLAEEGKV